jgi:general secretion pathway protein K
MCNRPWNKLIADQRGIALVLVLAMVALLVSLVVEFSHTMRVDVSLAANVRDELKALYTARSGVEMARMLLRNDDASYDYLEEDWAKFNEQPGRIAEDDEGRFNGVIEDETSKFPVNSIVDDEGQIVEERLTQLIRLFESLELDAEVLDAIIDWMDGDDETSPNGAEEDYYAGLSPSYACKNGPLSTIDELLLVKGMTEEMLYGDKEQLGLNAFLTVYSVDDKVNINTATAVVLRSLSDQMDEGLAQSILEYRQEEPFVNLSDEESKRVPGLEAVLGEIGPYLTTKSSYFRLTVDGEVRDIRKRIVAVMRRTDGEVRPVYWRIE